MDEVYTTLLDLPTTIRGYTVRDMNGDYNICINARISQENRLKAYKHELKHIKRGDFAKSGSADLIEIFAHQLCVEDR